MGEYDRQYMDPHVAYSFEVEIGGVLMGMFHEVGGLATNHEIFEIKEGGLNCHNHKFITRTTYGDITLKRGFICHYDMFDWFQASALGTWTERRDGIVRMMGPGDYEELACWGFKRAMPLKWEGPALNAMSSAIAIESITLSCEWIELQGLFPHS